MLIGEKLARFVRQTVSNHSPWLIRHGCLDVCLDNLIWQEKESAEPITSLVQLPPEDEIFDEQYLPYLGHYLLKPGEFVKARTVEAFDTRGQAVSGMFSLRSRYAQAGLEQSTSVWIQPDRFTGQLILELKNFSRYRTLLLEPGLAVGQVHFFEGKPK
jgi:deoxycytidine triphosphate deaminase